MASRFPNAIRRGFQAASRLHRDLNHQLALEKSGRPVDVFEAMYRLRLAVLIRPLENLLGAFVRAPTPGVLVTTRRPLSVQRFTAAHELGHFQMGHVPSLDDENILRRTLFQPAFNTDLQEVEANAFAVGFLMPRWLVARHCERHGWNRSSFDDPVVVYQLSLRLNVSYTALCWTLRRYDYVTPVQVRNLTAVSVRSIKSRLLGDYDPPNYHGDVWVLDQNDRETSLSGSRNDIFVLQLPEHSTGGYLWSVDDLDRFGFEVISDDREVNDQLTVGAETFRKVIASPEQFKKGAFVVSERRPWASSETLNELWLTYDLTGPEEAGWSRYERDHSLVAA